MASIRKEAIINRAPDDVWEVIRDVGAVHTRLARGFVTNTELDGDNTRRVTFANGTVVRERIVDLDDRARRIAYSVIEGQATHHNASIQVYDDGQGRSRLVWVADLLPNDLARLFDGMMDLGTAAMKETLEHGH